MCKGRKYLDWANWTPLSLSLWQTFWSYCLGWVLGSCLHLSHLTGQGYLFLSPAENSNLAFPELPGNSPGSVIPVSLDLFHTWWHCYWPGFALLSSNDTAAQKMHVSDNIKLHPFKDTHTNTHIHTHTCSHTHQLWGQRGLSIDRGLGRQIPALLPAGLDMLANTIASPFLICTVTTILSTSQGCCRIKQGR